MRIYSGLSISRSRQIRGGVPDIYGNVCVNKSAGKIFFTGYGANVDIGVNAKIPKNGIFVGSECKIFIGDDSDIEGWNLRCKSGNTLEIGKKVFGGTGNVFFYGNDATIKLEGGCRLNNPIIIKSFANSLIQIGSESSFGPGCQFWAHVSSCIKVGEKCLASNNITMIAGDGHSIFNEESGERINPVDIPGKNSIIIGNHCWLGFGAFFLSGEIKNSSIVGAGSLVKGRFPNNVIVAGNPATIIKENVTWTRNPLVKGIGACEEEYIQLTQYSEKTKQKTLDKERWYQEQISRLEDVIEKQNKDVQQAEIQKHEEKESLINKLNSLEKENQALQKKASEIKVSVNAQNESLSKSYELNAELKNQLLEKEALVVQMQSSFSWKITYPLRKIRYWQLNHQKKHR